MDNEATYQPKTIGTDLRNYYVDDCLQSVEDEEQGVRLVYRISRSTAKGWIPIDEVDGQQSKGTRKSTGGR